VFRSPERSSHFLLVCQPSTMTPHTLFFPPYAGVLSVKPWVRKMDADDCQAVMICCTTPRAWHHRQHDISTKKVFTIASIFTISILEKIHLVEIDICSVIIQWITKTLIFACWASDPDLEPCSSQYISLWLLLSSMTNRS
jgi:hypothetical protein